MVRGIQNARKEKGLEITDRIKLLVGGDESLKGAFVMFREFICTETLAVEAEWNPNVQNAIELDSEGQKWRFFIEKA